MFNDYTLKNSLNNILKNVNVLKGLQFETVNKFITVPIKIHHFDILFFNFY